ncbi:MAG: hypothetical protein ABI324_24180 [Ktedonobacteraceae bacterium]
MTDQNPSSDPLVSRDLASEASWYVALVTHAHPHRCYSNASRALLLLPDLLCRFVEGWVVVEGARRIVIIEHGWCLKGHQIIDPTWALLPKPGDQPVPVYIAGVGYTREETQALMGTCLPHVCCCGLYGNDGMQHPAYQAAYAAAMQKATLLAQEAVPPKEVVVTPAEPASTQKETAMTITITVISSSAFWSAFQDRENQHTGDMGGNDA